MIILTSQTGPWRFDQRRQLAAIFCALAVTLGVTIFYATEASAQKIFRPQQQRKQERIQKRNEGRGNNKLTPVDNTASNTQTADSVTKDNSRPAKHSLDGIRERGIRDFFSKEERELFIQGFGRETAFLLILRQLDLSPEQREAISGIRQRVGDQLVLLRRQHNALELLLEDAIYGENFDPKLVEQLSAQSGEKQAQISKLQASIEGQFRQILTPDQFFVFRYLVGEIVLLQRRPPLRPQQIQRRTGQLPTQQNRPE